MDLNNVPSSLMRGFSKDDFDKLLETLKNAVEESISNINDYNELIEEIRINNSNEKTDKWIDDFKNYVAISTEIINSKYGSIEGMFNRIFEDWEKYKIERENTITNQVSKDEKKDDVKDKGDTNE